MTNYPTFVPAVREKLMEYLDANHEFLSVDRFAMLRESIEYELHESLEAGENLWDCLERSMDYSSAILFDELNSLSLVDLLLCISDPDDIEGYPDPDMSAIEAVRCGAVMYIIYSWMNMLRVEWEREFGMDFANEEVILTE